MRAVVLALMVAGCSSAGADAERAYNMQVTEFHTKRDECTAAKKVADGYLKDGNQSKYATWNLSAKVKCGAADLSDMGY